MPTFAGKPHWGLNVKPTQSIVDEAKLRVGEPAPEDGDRYARRYGRQKKTCERTSRGGFCWLTRIARIMAGVSEAGSDMTT